MALVHRFTLPYAVAAGHDVFVQNIGLFTAGVLDIPTANTAAVSAVQAALTSTGVTDVGVVDSATNPTPAVQIGDPYPQYLTSTDFAGAVAVKTSDISQSLTAAYLSAFTPEAYGAKGDGTTDDTTAVQAALTAASAVNGTVFLGTNYLIPSGGLTASGRIQILGRGGIDGSIHATSALLCPSTTADVLTISADGVHLQDFAVINTASGTPTAGKGIRFTTNWWSHVVRVDTYGFYNNMSFEGGCYYEVTGCTILDPVNYGVYMTDVANQDYGEVQFHANTISLWNTSRTPAAAVRWESGGGLKFFGNKINGAFQPSPGSATAGLFRVGFDLAIQDGLGTVDCLITGNSIENCFTAHIRVGQKGPSNTGSMRNIVITGNECGYGAPTTYGVLLQPGAFNFLGSVVVTGNVFVNVPHCSIYAKWIDGLTIGTNWHKNCATSSSDNYHHIVYLDGGCYSASVAVQNVDGDARWLYYNGDEGDLTSFGHSQRNRIEHQYVREIPTTTSTSVYSTLYRFVLPQFWAGICEVNLTGAVKNVGSATLRRVRAVGQEATGTNAVLTTVGTDVTAGPGGTDIDLLLDTTSVAGELQVKVRLGAAGIDVFGQISVSWPAGGPQAVKKGA